jgi:hypothetical protein
LRGHAFGVTLRGDAEAALGHFVAVSARFREAGHPIDAQRCDGWAKQST